MVMTESLGSPELTVALALSAGVIAQTVAHHVKIPGIVLLLAAGVILGPDVLGVIHPSTLGHALTSLVGFAVAIILFEGGLNLNLGRVQRAGPATRHLLTLGAATTAVGGALAAKFFLDWPWSLSVLFGALVIVTGPTVVTPLLRRLKVERQVSTLLEVEGVLIDAIGAIIAVVALDFVISGGDHRWLDGSMEVLLRLGAGSLAGLFGGLVIAGLLRKHHLVPDGLENILTLSLVVALFFICDSILPESGLAAVTIAGVVVANVKTRIHEELREFKEQMTQMLIGLLFVLLAADVRMAEVVALGWPGLFTVLALIFIVRPLNVAVSTVGTGLSFKQAAFMAWIAPRGIVAAAVASHFANELNVMGIAGGQELRALVFMTIAITVVVSGLTGGFVADRLGLRISKGQGWIILGSHELARVLAHELEAGGEEVVIIDSNHEHCRIASAEGLTAINGNGLDGRILHQASVESRAGVVGLAPNEEVNLRFAENAKHETHSLTAVVALSTIEENVSERMVHEVGATVLFGRDRDLDAWAVQIRHGFAVIEEYELEEGSEADDNARTPGKEPESLLPLVLERDGKVVPVDGSVRFQVGDRVTFVVNQRLRDEAKEWLSWWGWARRDSSRAKSGVWSSKFVRASGQLPITKTSD
ncbi:MAG: NhaP-type Na+/H+ or K+/H+ antiporter/Trk K+ transport system NAD-binding subunit [Bradymonadia bacterium]|jgi:NhaP-type Na+/H+ or K+/H+ antiporter/Trk K+ transport system NAD-binding subunit